MRPNSHFQGRERERGKVTVPAPQALLPSSNPQKFTGKRCERERVFVVFLSFKAWGHQGARIVLHNLPVKKKKKKEKKKNIYVDNGMKEVTKAFQKTCI
jgi:hypothetical protein